jgi:hypothetical protein
MSGPASRCTPTTRRSRCSIPVEARPRPAGCGRPCGTSVRLAPRRRPPPSIGIRLIARPNTRMGCSRAVAASCMPTATLGADPGRPQSLPRRNARQDQRQELARRPHPLCDLALGGSHPLRRRRPARNDQQRRRTRDPPARPRAQELAQLAQPEPGFAILCNVARVRSNSWSVGTAKLSV